MGWKTDQRKFEAHQRRAAVEKRLDDLIAERQAKQQELWKLHEERMGSGMTAQEMMAKNREDMIKQGQKRMEDFANEQKKMVQEKQEEIQRGRVAADALIKQMREEVDAMKEEVQASAKELLDGCVNLRWVRQPMNHSLADVRVC